MSSGASVSTALRLCLRPASCGVRCARSTSISAAKVTCLVNYAKRYRAGLRVGTSVTEGTANFLVNRRMNKQQQMRGHDGAPTCCCRFVVRSTTVRSDPASATYLSQHPIRSSNRHSLLDPPTFGHSPALGAISSILPSFLSGTF